jgi:hypothetical protein
VSIELDLPGGERILLVLQKTCDAHDQAAWNLSFELQQGNPLAVVASLNVNLDPEYFPQAEATAFSAGLDDNQEAEARVAASVATDPDSSDIDKRDAIQSIIAVRETSGTGPR